MMYSSCCALFLGEALQSNGLVWRLSNDRVQVIHEKKSAPLCMLLRKLATEQGLADVELEFHSMVPKTHPVDDARDSIQTN